MQVQNDFCCWLKVATAEKLRVAWLDSTTCVCMCVGGGCGWLRLWAFQGLCLANRVVERRLTNCAAGSMRLHQLRAVRTSSGASIQKFCKILSHTQKCWLPNGGGGTAAAAARGGRRRHSAQGICICSRKRRPARQMQSWTLNEGDKLQIKLFCILHTWK